MPGSENFVDFNNQDVKGLSRESYGQYDLYDAKARNVNVEAVWKPDFISLESDEDNAVHGKQWSGKGRPLASRNTELRL